MNKKRESPKKKFESKIPRPNFNKKPIVKPEVPKKEKSKESGSEEEQAKNKKHFYFPEINDKKKELLKKNLEKLQEKIKTGEFVFKRHNFKKKEQPEPQSSEDSKEKEKPTTELGKTVINTNGTSNKTPKDDEVESSEGVVEEEEND